MSIVVACYNDGATLKRTLDSLRALNYPRKRYEIILVDDGSTDDTAKIAESYKTKIKYVRLPKNRGISAARNAGLKAATGEIHVNCDADCVVNKKWLLQIAKGYELDEPIGVGGRLVELETEERQGILRQFIGVRGEGFPPIVESKKNRAQVTQSPFKRLWRYITCNLNQPKPSGKAPVEVAELYGANASFPVKILKAVKGWSTDLSWIEDRDISLRIHKKFPSGHFYSMPGAIIKHDPAMGLKKFILRPYRRGPATFEFHQQNNMPMPIFPSPLLYLLALAAVAFLNYRYLPIVALVFPQILFFWWAIRGLKNKRPAYIAFPYLQLAEESMVIVGLLRGYLAGPKALLSTLSSVATTFLWAFIVANGSNGPLRAVVSTSFLALVPGYFGFRAIAGYRENESKVKIFSYSLGLSLILLMLTGLAVNQAILFAGRSHPLVPQLLVPAIAALTIALILVSSLRKRAEKKTIAVKETLKKLVRALPAVALCVSLPILAVGGAITLNNGGSNWLSMTTFGLIGALFIALAWRDKNVAKYYPLALYCMSLAILLGTSMRGWNITGHDIMQEYQVFQLTLQHATWDMHYYQDAYNACLSITILPTIFQKLTGISDPYIYKFVFQLFTAMLAPIIFLTLRGHVSKKIAFLTAFTFMTFPTFLTDVAMLNRQTIALLCFALSLLIGLDTSLTKTTKRILVPIFLAGMILSHYSTSYVALGVLGVALVLGYILVIGAKLLKKKANYKTGLIYSAVSVIFAAVVIYSWGTLVTHTSGNITKTLTGLATSTTNLLTHKSPKPVNKPTGSSLSQYIEDIKQHRVLPAADYYPASTIAAAPVTELPSQTMTPESATLRQLHIPQSLLTTIFNVIRQGYAAALIALIFIGLVLMSLKKTSANLPRQYTLLGIASLAIIGLQVVAPSGVIDYGILRVLQQNLILLALPVILAGLWILGKMRTPENWQPRIVAIALLGFFMVLSGFVSTLTGGFKPVLALSNSGFYYEAYYTHQSEVTADRWLLTNSPKGSRVYADEFARRKMITYTDSKIFAQPVLVPVAIPVDSYVYLSNGNTSSGIVPLYVPIYLSGNLASYKLPKEFFDQNKNLLYNSSQVIIYK
jgi:uncharacterized membrane protein/glycosyltransferase involved in cell wall biosynthesis